MRVRGFPQVGPLVRFVDWELSTDSIVFFAPVDTVEKRRLRRSGAESACACRVDESRFVWGRLGTAEEVADVVAFLLSDRARWVNGTNVAVDGAQGRPSAF